MNGTADPYAKIRLLPDRDNVWQTRVDKKTLNPGSYYGSRIRIKFFHLVKMIYQFTVFDEDFVFELRPSSISFRTLEIILFDFNPYSRHHGLGGVKIHLSELDLSQKITLWKSLEPCAEPDLKVSFVCLFTDNPARVLSKFKMGKKELPTLGRLFGRADIERCDLFIDYGFLNWGKYETKKPDSRGNGRQMLSGVPDGGRKKCGLQSQAGYFEKEFTSIFVNDPYKDMRKAEKSKGNTRRGEWLPNGPTKRHATPGDYYGSFGKYPAFSPLRRPEKKKAEEPRNFTTRPGKKGTSGFLDITINKYPEHAYRGKVDFYYDPEMEYKKKWEAHLKKIRAGPLVVSHPAEYFDKNPYFNEKPGPTYVEPKAKETSAGKGIFYPPAGPKSPGGNHDGCFEKLPKWQPEVYLTQAEVFKKLTKSNKKYEGRVFLPAQPIKSYYTSSVMNNKIDISCNERTWKTMKPITYPQFN